MLNLQKKKRSSKLIYKCYCSCSSAFSFNLNPRAAYREYSLEYSFLSYLYLYPIRESMDNIEIFLVLVVIFIAAAFVVSFMRLWFVTHYDANLGKKVKGLSLSFDKLRKDVRTHREQSSNNIRQDTNINADEMAEGFNGLNLDNMTLEEAAESIGIDPEQLNNPVIRPMAEKIFQGIKAKAKEGGDADGVRTETGY